MCPVALLEWDSHTTEHGYSCELRRCRYGKSAMIHSLAKGPPEMSLSWKRTSDASLALMAVAVLAQRSKQN